MCVGNVCGGGNAVPGVHNQVVTGVSPSDAIGLYGANDVGPRATGWACLIDGTNVCTCVGLPNFHFCTNGAPAGTGGDTVTGVSTANVIATYGATRIGVESTGWACHASGAGAGNNMSYSCLCAGVTCGNGSPAGQQGDIVVGVSPVDVASIYGPDRIAPRTTGWSCAPTASNIMECVGLESGFYSCDNGAPAGNGGDLLQPVSTATARTTYGLGRIGDAVTGWAATPSRTEAAPRQTSPRGASGGPRMEPAVAR